MIRPFATLVNRTLRVYWRIRRPVTFGVRAIVLRADGRLLLVRHTYDRYWYLPGGGMRRGEPAEAALARELREELGIAEAAIERRLGVYLATREGKRDTVTVFVARAEALGRLQRLEIAAADWVDPAALPDGTSPATRRRIAEFLGQAPVAERW